MVTVVGTIAGLVVGLGLLGMWPLVWVVVGFAVALAIVELWTLKGTGLTVTHLFRQEVARNKGKALLASVMLLGAMVVIVLHLWGYLP